MLSSKNFIKMVTKWNYTGAMSPKSIIVPGSMKFGNEDGVRKPNASNSSCFVFYTIDWIRFNIPIAFLKSNIFLELFKISEEEFGINSNGPIMMPFDSTVMNYIVSLVQRGMSKDLENALLSIIISSRCSLATPFSDQGIGHQLLVSS